MTAHPQQEALVSPSLPNNYEGKAGMFTRTNVRRSVKSDSRDSSSRRSERNDHGDWLQGQALQRSRHEIHKATGLTPRGAENIRLGESKVSFDALVEWCRNDPLFRAEFFKYCGGELETDPEFYAHLSMAIASYQRRPGV